MSKKLLFKDGLATGMRPYEIEDFSTLYMRDARVDEKTKAYIDSVIGNSVLNLCPYRNVLVTHKYDTVEGNVITLDDCQDDEVIQLSEIQGNTMVNCCKDGSKELTLNGDIDTSGYNNVTLTEGVDGGKVDIALEGNTMVNVCDQEDPIAITKNYEVTTGNHVALQGEYDGKCRPNIYGNTLVNLNTNKLFYSDSSKHDYCLTYTPKKNTLYTVILDLNYTTTKDTNIWCGFLNGERNAWKGQISNLLTGMSIYTVTTEDSDDLGDKFRIGWNDTYISDVTVNSLIILEGDYTNKPIPEYFTGMQSSFEDKLVPENLYKFSSRDDFYSLDGGTTLDGEYIKMTANSGYQNAMLKPLATIKPSTTYTIIVDVVENTLNSKLVITAPVKEKDVQLFTTQTFQIDAGKTGIFTQMATTSNDLSGCIRCLVNYLDKTNTTGSIKYRIMVVEGDYTKYDFTDYDSTKGGKYKVDYKVTGKNKWNGAGNTMDKYTLGLFQESYQGRYIKVGKPNTNYVLSVTDPIIPSGHWVVINAINPTTGALSQAMNICKTGQNSNNDVRNIVVSSDSNGFVRLSIYTYGYTEEHWKVVQNLKFQIEEGDTVTTYEPYKEYTKTLYLNTPLLEGDTIEQSGNDIVHVHRYGSTTNKHLIPKYIDLSDTNNYRSDTSCACLFNFKNSTYSKPRADTIVYCDKLPFQKMSWSNTNIDSAICTVNSSYDFSIRLPLSVTGITAQDSKDECIEKFKTWNDNNLINIVYELATPKKEVISTNDNLLLDSYVNGHLDVDSVVPIDKVAFKSYGKFLKYLYPSIEYTIQFESDNKGILNALALNDYDTLANLNIVKGINKFTITTGDKINSSYLWTDGIGFNMSKIVVTPKVNGEFGYFKGMKSVGQNDVEGNKIEILSRNKNLLDNLIPYPITVAENDSKHNDGALLGVVKVKPNTTYIMSVTRDKEAGRVVAKMSNRIILPTELPQGLFIQDDIYNFLKSNYANGRSFEKIIYNQDFIKFTTLSDCNYLYVNVDSKYNMDNDVTEVTISNVQIEEVKDTSTTPTTYTPHKSNKKEILMNEALRGLPNGIKDKYVMIDGKWYIERNCGYGIFDGSDDENWIVDNQYGDNGDSSDCVGFKIEIPNIIECVNGYGAEIIGKAFISNNLKVTSLFGNKVDGINWGWGKFIFVKCSRAIVLNDFKSKLSVQPLKVIYQLATPTYEPIDYNPFEVYSDITHISNNSTIPCNMVIKNSGYNTIIKPSTLYTVALDTNKSGTIGLNLGGAKVTTTNNVTTITTPATLTDNTLTLYGKGIKASGVRLLEGDKTNWIPSRFEGMKSCFEDKLQDDGKYKMEILSNNRNLLNLPYTNGNRLSSSKTLKSDFSQSVVVGKTYTFSFNTNIVGANGSLLAYCLSYEDMYYKGNTIYVGLIGRDRQTITFTATSDKIYFIGGVTKVCEYWNFQLEENTEVTDYIPHQSNKIQFLLNEPLRGVGDIKDKVYVKEDKIVVERNIRHKLLTGADNEIWVVHNDSDKNVIEFRYNTGNPFIITDSDLTISDKLIGKSGGNIDRIAWSNDTVYITISRNKLATVDVAGLRQWLSNNNVSVQNQLATPVYEEVECDLSKLALEGYDHGTLFYDTNIPVTTQFYEFNVNIKDMLIPNETYYVTFTADRIKDITINLSGVQVNYKTSMGYNKVPIQLGDVVNTNFSMDSRGVELSDLMISTSTSLIYVKDMNDVCVYDETTNKYSITITSTNGKESDKRVILLDYPLLRLNKDIYDRLYYSNKDSKYKIDKKVFKHKFTNNHEYNKYAAETNDTYYSSFISLNEAIKDYVVITNEKVKTIKVEDDKYYFKIKWSDLGVSDKTEANGNQGVKDFFNNNEVYLYYATDGFVEIVDGLTRQTLKVYQPETIMKFLGNTTTTVTILIPMKNV